MGAARGSGSMGWKTYDEQFRTRRSINTLMSWAAIDTELIHSSQTHSPATGGRINTLPTTNVSITTSKVL